MYDLITMFASQNWNYYTS